MPGAEPLPASAPLTAPSSGSTWNENYLSLEELLRNLKRITTKSNLDGEEDRNWRDRGLSGWACYEVIYGALLDKTGKKSKLLLEALSFFVDQTLSSPAPDVVKNGLQFFRPLVPALHQLLHVRDCSGWAARMLASVCLKEGVLTDNTVHELQRALEENEDFDILTPSRPNIVEALKALQPLRPDVMTEDFSDGSTEAQFPAYSPYFQNTKATQNTKNEDFGDLPPKKTFHTKYPTALERSHKSRRWFTGDALVDPDNFTALWTKMRFPDQLLCLLTDANYLTAYWLSARPGKSAVTMERRFLGLIQDLLANEGRARSSEDTEVSEDESLREGEHEGPTNIAELQDFVSSHIHETLPAVSSMAMDAFHDLDSPMDKLMNAVRQISLIYLSGNGLQTMNQTFKVIAGRFLEASEADQVLILEGLRTMLRDWQRDLPRLWDLESEVSDQDKITLAKQSFVHSETAIQAAYVDTCVTFRIFVDLIDKILWKPAVSDNISTRYWNEIVQLWKQVIEVIEKGEEAPDGTYVSRYLPHPQLMLIGSLQSSNFIQDEMKTLLDRCWKLSEPSDKKEQLRMRELYDLFEKKRLKPVRRK